MSGLQQQSSNRPVRSGPVAVKPNGHDPSGYPRKTKTRAGNPMHEDLKQSGIPPHLYKYFEQGRQGYKIPYYTADGKKTKFYRFRSLEQSKYGEKTQRYTQPAGVTPDAYLTPGIPWTKLFADPSKLLGICEGEKKSMKACDAFGDRLPTIGLGGVECFSSKKKGWSLLPVLAAIEWNDRKVYIFYDSDAASNPDVVRAENRLARELTMRGAVVYICRIPTLNGKKTGVDDYLVAKGKDADTFWEEVITPAVDWAPSEELFRLNEQVVYVRDPGMVVELATRRAMRAHDFMSHVYANRKKTEVRETKTKTGDTTTKLVERKLAREWIEWPHRREVNNVTHAPGAGIIVDGQLNLWRGWGCAPVKGDITPWKKLLAHVFTGALPEHRRWFEQWLACPLQHPGIKLFTAAVLWSPNQGTGKGTVGQSVGKIHGSGFTEIGNHDLVSTFNEWAVNRTFVMADEITSGVDKRKTADRMKSMITQQQVRINIKNVPSYVVPDRINYLFTSNNHDALYIENNDRRFFIHEVTASPTGIDWEKYYKWLNADGAAALFYHLLHLDLTGFNPAAHAPATTAKRDMQEAGMGALRLWVEQIRTNPAETLVLGELSLAKRTLATSRELVAMFKDRTDGKVPVDEAAMGRTLRRAGYVKVPRHDPKNDKVRGLVDDSGEVFSTSVWWIQPGSPPEALGTLKGVRDQYYKERRSKKKDKF